MSTAGEVRYSVLAVDDEPNILSALRRTLRARGYEIEVADSGAKGLEAMARREFDVVISDMRMPEMTGAEFLREARKRHPDTIRILLTGYSDITSTVEAVNHGEIFRYLSKPWEDEQLVSVLEDGLERKRLRHERERLLAITESQNAELKRLNEGLEKIVAERTANLKQALAENEEAHAKLKEGFVNTVRAFASIVEARAGLAKGCARRVAAHVRAIGLRAGLSEEMVQDTVLAALLQDLGKLALPDPVLARPLELLNGEERQAFLRHPVHGQSFLMALEPLRNAGLMLKALHERFDGKGVPDGLVGLEIPAGSRLLAVASDYEGLLAGAITERALASAAAAQWLLARRGKRYDPAMVALFLGHVGVDLPGKARPCTTLRPHELKPGLVLARDLVSRDGVLLLAQEQALTEALVRHIVAYEKLLEEPLWITVHR